MNNTNDMREHGHLPDDVFYESQLEWIFPRVALHGARK